MNEALILFSVCTFANVIISTIKSVMTIKGGKISAALWNALSYGLYSFIVVMTATAEISTLEKVLVTIGCNLVGVYGVKLVEEKLCRDRLWKLDLTVRSDLAETMHYDLTLKGIPNSYVNAGKHTVFNCYCETKEDTKTVLRIAKFYDAKTFASETALNP